MSDLIDAQEETLLSGSKIIYHALFLGPRRVMGTANTSVSVPLILQNGGPLEDTYPGYFTKKVGEAPQKSL